MTKSITFVPEFYIDNDKILAGFVALVAWVPLYEDYSAKYTRSMYGDKLFPVVLLMNRWDGMIGFPGGKAEGDETAKLAARRELLEETEYYVTIDKLIHCHGYTTDKVVGHLYIHNLGIVTKQFLCDVIVTATQAQGFISEGSPFWAHLMDYGKENGWTKLRNSSGLATSVPEELDVVRKYLLSNPPDNIWNPEQS